MIFELTQQQIFNGSINFKYLFQLTCIKFLVHHRNSRVKFRTLVALSENVYGTILWSIESNDSSYNQKWCVTAAQGREWVVH